jgi:photosystem II stability/assembly factor-like uncharacterized protein
MRTLNTTSRLMTLIALLAISAIFAAPANAMPRKHPAQGDESARAGNKTNTRSADSHVTPLKSPPAIEASRSAVEVTDIGPERGLVLGLEGFLIDPGNPQEILASTDRDGVFKSTNGGQSWHPANVGLLQSSGRREPVPNIRRDPSHPRTVYAVTFSGLYRSTDFGDHWIHLSDSCCLRDVAISPTHPSVLFAVDSEGFFYKSTDSGVTLVPQTGIGWPHRDPDNDVFPNFTNVVITPADPQTMYVVDHLADFSGIYKSTDGGASFTLLSDTPFFPAQIFPHPTQRDTIFLEAFDSTSTGLFRSLDGGATFTELTGGLPPGPDGVQFVTFDPEKPSTLYAASSGGLLRSTDGGSTFTSLGITPDQLGAARGGAIVVNLDPTNPKVLYVNTVKGNFKSIDHGRSFTEIDNGFRATVVTYVAFDNAEDPSLYVIADNVLFRTRDRGRHYDELTLPHDAFPTAVAVDPTDRNKIVVTTSSDGIFRSIDGGRSWSESVVDTGDPFFSGANIAFDPQDTRNVYVASGAFFRSADGGRTFATTPVFSVASALAIDPQHPEVLYFSGGNGLIGPALLLRSSDRGLTFADAITAIGVVNRIIVNPHDSRVVYAGGVVQLELGEPYPTDFYLVVRSTDGGVTFTPADAGLSVQLLTLGIDPMEPDRLFAMCPAGLFQTEDGGTSWKLLDPGGETFLRGPDTLAINPKKPRLLYLGAASLLEVEIKH